MLESLSQRSTIPPGSNTTAGSQPISRTERLIQRTEAPDSQILQSSQNGGEENCLETKEDPTEAPNGESDERTLHSFPFHPSVDEEHGHTKDHPPRKDLPRRNISNHADNIHSCNGLGLIEDDVMLEGAGEYL